MFDIERYKKSQFYYTKIPKYAPISILIRFVVVSIIAVLTVRFIENLNAHVPYESDVPTYVHYLIVIVAFNLLSEGLIVIDNLLELCWPIPEKLKRRLGIQFLLTLLLIVAVYLFTDKIAFAFLELKIDPTSFYLGIASGLIFVTMFSSTLLLSRFTEKWVNDQKHIDELKREKLKMDYSVLQDQLNPHFLFNNLSVLKSLIIYDSNAAVAFTENFTDVYRYVLQSKEKQVVGLREEFEFIKSYVALHKERIGKGLEVDFDLQEKMLNQEIAPMTLQLLIENAIKHNITSKATPLKIEVSSQEEYVLVKNNLQLKESSYSTKTGLSNLVNRYQLLTEKEIQVDDGNGHFEVKVPLL